MTNKLTVKETQRFMGIDILVIEGGFGKKSKGYFSTNNC